MPLEGCQFSEGRRCLISPDVPVYLTDILLHGCHILHIRISFVGLTYLYGPPDTLNFG